MPSSPNASKRNVVALIRNHLLGLDTLTAEVEDRIRTTHTQDPDGQLTYPLLIIDAETGIAGYQGTYQRLTVRIYAYSDESQDQADALYDLAYLATQAVRLWDPSGVIPTAGYMREVERPEPGFNDQTRAWFSRGTWIVNTAG